MREKSPGYNQREAPIVSHCSARLVRAPSETPPFCLDPAAGQRRFSTEQRDLLPGIN